jgi:hypothetical protein
MPVNDTITQADYNSIRNKLVSVIGTGSATLGWGQTIVSSAVDVNTSVSINEWGRLRFDIINAHRHIFGTTPTTAQPALGNTIRYSNTFVPDNSSDAPVTQYDTYANSITSNRFTVHSSQAATAAAGSMATTWPGIYGADWTARLRGTITVSWPSANAARHFFNSGGELRFASSRSGGSGTQQNTAWNSLLTSAGTRAFGANMPGTGTSPMNGQNWYRLTSSFQEWYTISSSTPYGSNNYKIYARTPSVADNSGGAAASAEFLIEFNDGYVDPGVAPGSSFPVSGGTGVGGGGGGVQTATPADFPPGDSVDGTFTTSVSYLYATGVLEPPGTGNFTVTQPSITFGVIAPA